MPETATLYPVVIVAFDLMAALFFGLAVLWGFYNARAERDITEFWLVYMLASVAGSIFMLLRALEWSGFHPALMDDVQPFFGIVGITLISTDAIICALSRVEHQVK